MSQSSDPNRRDFVRTTTTTAAAIGAGLALPSSAPAKPVTGKLRLGLIGCGGRGTGATVQALKADSDTELWAMGDVFAPQIENSRRVVETEFQNDPVRVAVTPERRFVGLDAYEKVLNSGIDVVLIATPGGFRPYHLTAAVAAGKHVFCEKPMAVDPHGIRLVMAAVKEAKRRQLAIRAGFNMRFEPSYRAAMKRIQDGAIGDIRAIYSTRMSNRLARFDGTRQPDWGDLEYQLRNWHYFSWLSGDLILEVTVHSIDKIAWAMGDVPPEKIVASGARHQQEHGDIFDQFDVTYEYGNGVIAVLKSRYMTDCFNEHKDLIIGSRGRCELGWSSAKITGATNWRYQGEKVSSHQIEHDELFADLRQGLIPNDGDRMISSTMMGIAGRMCAYTGRDLTWEQAFASKLRTMPEELDWDMKLPLPAPARPGITRLI